MRKIRKLVAGAVLVAAVGIGGRSAEAQLANCSTVRVYQQVSSVCRTQYPGSGLQRVRIICGVTGSTQQWNFYGPWVGVNQWSRAECPYPMVLKNYWTDIQW